MFDSDQFLEQERRRLEVEAAALAKVKAEVIPSKRYAEPPAVPDATASDLWKWQAGILGAFVTLNLSLLRRLRRPGREELLVLAVGNLALLAALAYTRYRMYKLPRKK